LYNVGEHFVHLVELVQVSQLSGQVLQVKSSRKNGSGQWISHFLLSAFHFIASLQEFWSQVTPSEHELHPYAQLKH
jgi:hypothetical protein